MNHLSISRKNLGRVLFILFLISLIPLVWIAVYNYPADDDFRFVLGATQSWHQTHSVSAALKAMIDTVRDFYRTWQGDFVSVFFFQLTPMILDVKLYFISNWIMLLFMCLATAYLIKSVLRRIGGDGQRVTFLILYPLFMTMILQFMPDIGNSVFWQNGGQYTTCVMTLFCVAGILMRTEETMTPARSVFRAVLLVLGGFELGGSFYGPMLGALVYLLLMGLRSFLRKSPSRPYYVLTLISFLAAMIISIKAPGNAVRQGGNGNAFGIPYTVVHTALESFELAGGWLTPQWFAAAAVIFAALWQPLRRSKYDFRHPFMMFVILYGMFCSTLAPGLYSGAGYHVERYMNAIYFYFTAMSFGSLIYAEGALIRFLERKALTEETSANLLRGLQNVGTRFTAWFLVLVLALFSFGLLNGTPMNTPSVNSAKCLLTGEAQTFRQKMADRQEYILNADMDTVQVNSFAEHPAVFKHDRLPFQGNYGTVRYMHWYFKTLQDAGL